MVIYVWNVLEIPCDLVTWKVQGIEELGYCQSHKRWNPNPFCSEVFRRSHLKRFMVNTGKIPWLQFLYLIWYSRLFPPWFHLLSDFLNGNICANQVKFDAQTEMQLWVECTDLSAQQHHFRLFWSCGFAQCVEPEVCDRFPTIPEILAKLA